MRIVKVLSRSLNAVVKPFGLTATIRPMSENTEKPVISRLQSELSADDVSLIRDVGPFTLTTVASRILLVKACDYVVSNRIGGDFVECGVWRGGSIMIALRKLAGTERRCHLYDTFEGMSAPSDQDIDLFGGVASDKFDMTKTGDGEFAEWADASLEEVQTNLAGFCGEGALTKCVFVMGKVEETLPDLSEKSELPTSIAILRLDTDWYESTKCELEYLYDRVSPGGVVIIDDYGHWEGAKRATDSFLEERGLTPMMFWADYTCRCWIKS